MKFSLTSRLNRLSLEVVATCMPQELDHIVAMKQINLCYQDKVNENKCSL